jgi:hypothetical protein
MNDASTSHSRNQSLPNVSSATPESLSFTKGPLSAFGRVVDARLPKDFLYAVGQGVPPLQQATKPELKRRKSLR